MFVGRVNSAREQDSSIGGDAGYVCLGVVHMEEEVQDRVQVEVGREEQGERETHGEGQSEGQRSNKQSTARHGWLADGMSACLQTLEPWLVLSHAVTDACNVHEKMTCEVYLSTHPVGYNGSTSTVNETNCKKRVTFFF